MGEKSCGTFISHFLSIFRYKTFFRTLKITKVFRKSGSDKSIGDFKITYDMLVVVVTAVEWCVVMIDVEFCVLTLTSIFRRLSEHATWADWKLFKDSFLTR